MRLTLLSISLFCITCKTEQQKVSTVSNTSITVQKDTVLSYNLYNDLKDEYCEDWKEIKPLDILRIIRGFKEISSQEWHQCFGHFSCGGKGELIFNNQKFNYNLNSGGWLYLKGLNTEKYLGSMNKKDTLKGFISVYYCDEEWGD